MSGLEARLDTQHPAAPQPAAFPEILAPISAALLGSKDASNLAIDYVANPYAGPFLQQLLLAQKGNQ